MADDLNSLLNKLKEDKQRIRIAIETKLNTHIPAETKLDVFDDYIYKINSAQEYSKNLLTIPKDMELFRYNEGTEENPEPSIESVYFDVNLVEPEETPSSGPDLPEGKKYSTAKYITVERPDDLLPKYIASGKTIFGITGSGFNPDDPTTATCDYVAATPDGGGENITFMNPMGVVSQGALINNCGESNLNTTLTDPRFSSSGYFSSIGVKPTGRYIVNNNSELNVQLSGNSGVVKKINQSSYDDKYKILPGNIKVGCNIFGVAGTFSTEENNPITVDDIAQDKIGFVNGEKVTGVVPIRNSSNLTISYGDKDSYINAKYGLYKKSPDTTWDAEVEHKINNATLYLSIQDNFSKNYDDIYTEGNESERFVSGYRTYNARANLENSDGPIKAGTRTVISEYTISPSMLIDQKPFNNPDEYDAISAADSGNVLQGALFVDRQGRVRKGTMPIIAETTWDRAVFTDNKLQITPFSSSVFSPNVGYYSDSSKVYISQDVIKDAYNRSVLGTKQIRASNIKAGCNIFGVEGSYGGGYAILTKVINPIDLDFKGGQNSIIFEPNFPKSQAWNKVTVNRDPNLTPENIPSEVTIYGITGTFTSKPSTGQSLASPSSILNGYSAWVDGKEVKGNILVNTIDDGNIYTKEKSFSLNGYYSAGTTIRISPEEQNKLIPGNIRIGETILGVTGTYKGGVLLETTKDSSLDETNASSPVKLDSNGTSFTYNSDGKNAKNRICWYTKNYNIPLAIANSDKYFIPEGAEVSFNVIPNIIGGSTVLPLLVNIFSVEDDYTTDPMNPQEITNNITWDYLVDKGKFNYNLLVSKPSSENPDIKIYSIRNISEGVDGYTIEGAIVYPIDESNINTVWNYGAFEYIKQFDNPGKVEFSHNELPADINGVTNLYKRYNISVKSKDGVYVNVSDTTAISSDVLKGKYFHDSNGLLIQGSLIKTYDIVTNLEKLSGVKSSINYLGNSYDVGSFIYSKTGSDTGIWVNIEKENSGPPFNWKIIYNNSVLDEDEFRHLPDSDNWIVVQRNIILDNGYNITSYLERDDNLNPICYVIKFEKIDYIDTTATPERVLSPYKFYDINGTLQTGTFSLTTKTIEANGENITPSSPYGGFSSVTVNVPQTNLVTYKILSNITGGRSIGGNTTAGIYASPNDSGIVIYYPGASALSPWYLYVNNSSTGQEIDSEFYDYDPTGGDFTIEFDSENNNVYIQESIYSDSDLDPGLPVIPYILDIV